MKADFRGCTPLHHAAEIELQPPPSLVQGRTDTNKINLKLMYCTAQKVYKKSYHH